jgi:hypothetical protein
VLTWAVDESRFEDGDDIEVVINSMTLYTGSYVASGQWWTDPVATATVTTSLTDAGEGAGG